MTTERQTGTVTKWLNHRGIGFITPKGEVSEIGSDILVHYSNIKQDNGTDTFKSLAEGSTVEFDTTTDPKNPDKLIAINVTGIGGVDCEKKQRSNRGASRRISTDTFELSVENLSKKTSWRDVKDLFRQCGTVDWVDVKDGHGVVAFTKAEDAQNAVERFNGFSLHGQELKVEHAKK